MEQSERVYQRKEEIKSEIELTKKQRIERLAEIQESVLSLVVAERVLDPGDLHLVRLQHEVAEIRKRLYAQEKELIEELKVKERELYALTAPAIQKGIESVSFQLRLLKLEKKVLERAPSGFTMTRRLILETNEDAIAKIQHIIRDAIQKLQNMAGESVLRIESFVEETLASIRKIDLRPIKKEVEEFSNERRDFLTSPVTR